MVHEPNTPSREWQSLKGRCLGVGAEAIRQEHLRSNPLQETRYKELDL